MPMTNKEYVENSGIHCPYCESIELTATNSVEMDGGFGTQTIKCLECEEVWEDKFALIGYEASKY